LCFVRVEPICSNKNDFREASGMANKTAVRVSELRGYARLFFDAAAAIAGLSQEVHETVLRTPGPFGQAARGLTGGIVNLVYGGVRNGIRLCGAGTDWLLTGPDDGDAEPFRQRDIALAALNGVYGDQLAATGNPLAIPMRFRCAGRTLPLDRKGLAAALPGAGGRVAVLVHGLCKADWDWTRHRHDHGVALATRLGFTPVYLFYNSGRHVSVNGREFAAKLEELIAQWPVPVEELAIVGHSMGGLVARSACHYGDQAGHAWRRMLRKMVFLGAPHHGAPLERIGARVDHVLAKIPYAAAFGRIGRIRSAGITDLRYGALLDEDWRDRDRFALDGDCRRPVPLPEGVACYAVAATTAAAVNASMDRWFGDGLVPMPSALGEHDDPARRLAFPPERQWIGTGMNHFDLLSRRDVCDRILLWLTPRS
jgi:pimeloyl-ACP methyl ester carboxylesterase